jgi:ssDNA-binding Zn-finger/Zn-ribbon topoisomerase 1
VFELVDKTLKCKVPGCGKDFVFTKGEQAFFLQKAYAAPTRCPDCRKLRKKDRRKRRRELLRTLVVADAVEVKDTGGAVNGKPASLVAVMEVAKLKPVEVAPESKKEAVPPAQAKPEAPQTAIPAGTKKTKGAAVKK